jgi:foldase protein PrsA
MKNVAKVVALLLIFVLAVSLAGCSMVQDGTVATINGEEVSLAEYQYVLNSIGAQMLQNATDKTNFWETEIDGVNALEKAKQDALDTIANNMLIRQKAKELGLTLTQEETDAITQNKNQMLTQLGGKEGYEKKLKELGINDKIYSDMMDRAAYAQKHQQYLMENDENFKEPSDEQIQQVFAEKYIKAKHILYKTVDDSRNPLPQEQIDDAKRRAESALAQIKAGTDFDAIMNAESEDPGLAQYPDGYVFTQGEMVPEFYNAAVALKEGEISDLVYSSSTGYHIIKRVPIDFSKDITEEVKSNVTNTILSERYNVLLKNLREKATITKNDKVLRKLKVQEIKTN